jgi:hypothetical protein
MVDTFWLTHLGFVMSTPFRSAQPSKGMTGANATPDLSTTYLVSPWA